MKLDVPQIDVPLNSSLNYTITYSAYKLVYWFSPIKVIELRQTPIYAHKFVDAEKSMEGMIDFFMNIKINIGQRDEVYKDRARMNKREEHYQIVLWLWCIKISFPKSQYNKSKMN